MFSGIVCAHLFFLENNQKDNLQRFGQGFGNN